MDPITIALTIAVAVVVSYIVSDPDRDADTRTHRHRYGDSIGGYYIHTHWYANEHTHYTVAQQRSDVRADPFVSAVADVATDRHVKRWRYPVA